MNVTMAMRRKTCLHASAHQHLWFDDLHVFSWGVCMANRDILRQSFTGSVLKRRGFHIDWLSPESPGWGGGVGVEPPGGLRPTLKQILLLPYSWSSQYPGHEGVHFFMIIFAMNTKSRCPIITSKIIMSNGSIAAAWASLIPHGFTFALRLWYSG